MNARAAIFLLVVGGLSGCATVPSGPADTKSSDSGYFLSMKQKGQLIGTGRIQDAQGVWYDVWLVPGYTQPARRVRTYVQRTGSDLAEYVQPQKYHDIAKFSGNAFEWAFEDCFTDFTVKGVPRAWVRYWSAANQRTSQRVFGWWLAYPWAVLEGTVDTVVRVPVGLLGTVLGATWGTVVVPGYYTVNSAVAGSWHLGVDAVLLPTVAGAWNTVIAPPMALVGQKPAPSRADGFWVKQLSMQEVQAASTVDTPISGKDVEALAEWSRLLLTTSQPYEERRQALRTQTQAEQDALIRKAQQAEADIRSEEQNTIQTLSLRPIPAQQETLDYLRGRGFDAGRISQAADEVRHYLESGNELSPAEVYRAVYLLTLYPPSAVTNPPPLRPKTDPVERSMEIIKDIQ